MARPLRFSTVSTDDQAEGFAQALSHCYARPIADARTWVSRYRRDDMAVVIDPASTAPGAVAAGLVLIEMGHSYGGTFVPGVGIAGVAVMPEARGRGTATFLMDRTVQHLHRRGAVLTGLYPATQALYRRSGYEQAGHRCLLRAPLHRLPTTERSATVRPATERDTPEIRRLYDLWARATDGALGRYEDLWRRNEMIPPMREEKARCFVVEGARPAKRAPAPLEGYVFMHMPQGAEGKPEVHVIDMVAISARAGRRLWALLGSHSTICTDLVWHCTPAHPMLTLLPEQSFKLSLHLYWMLRVLDAARALEQRGYPRGLHAELAFDLDDPLIKPNNGRLVLRVKDGVPTVTRDPKRRFAGPRVALSIDTLAMLYSGFQPAGQLVFLDRIAASREAVAVAGALFGGQTPAMCEMF